MLKDVLKKYDKTLIVVRYIDGRIIITRKSPYNVERVFNIMLIENQYTGSCKWIRKKIIKMDTRRFDIVGDVLRHNHLIFEREDDKTVHGEIADFITSGGERFVN